MEQLGNAKPQTDPALDPNQQDPTTLLAPDSAPEAHKSYHDREVERAEESSVQGINLHQEDGENAGAPTDDPMAKSSGQDGNVGAWTDHGDGLSHTI